MFNKFLVSRKKYDRDIKFLESANFKLECELATREVTNTNYLPLRDSYTRCRDENMSLKRKLYEIEKKVKELEGE